MIANNDIVREVFTFKYYEPFSNAKERTVTIPTTLIDVKEGDTISLCVRGTAGDVVGGNGNGQISILVEEY